MRVVALDATRSRPAAISVQSPVWVSRCTENPARTEWLPNSRRGHVVRDSRENRLVSDTTKVVLPIVIVLVAFCLGVWTDNLREIGRCRD